MNLKKNILSGISKNRYVNMQGCSNEEQVAIDIRVKIQVIAILLCLIRVLNNL